MTNQGAIDHNTICQHLCASLQVQQKVLSWIFHKLIEDGKIDDNASEDWKQ